MDRKSMLEVRIGALEPTLSSKNTRIEALETQLTSKNSESVAATAELESKERCLRFAENAVSLMREEVSNIAPHLQKMELARLVSESARASAESDVQSLTTSERICRVKSVN